MHNDDKTLIQANPWDELRCHTNARIALGRVGSSLPTREVLKFGLAHAQARDAVHRPLDFTHLKHELHAEGFRTLHVHSNAQDRQTYLLRPDYGRQLHDESRIYLEHALPAPELAVVICDGLSSIAASVIRCRCSRPFANDSAPTGPTHPWSLPNKAALPLAMALPWHYARVC